MSEPVHIVCLACLAINRVPAERLGQSPICGNCKKALFAGEPSPLTSTSLHRLIEHNDIPVVVDFWAPWCGPCKSMAPEFARAARELEPEMRLANIDTEAEPSLGSEFDIRSIPTVVLFYTGRERARRSGAMRAADIVRWARETAGQVDASA